MKFKILLPLLAAASTAIAGEGGSRHYLLGAMATFIDSLPGREAIA